MHKLIFKYNINRKSSINNYNFCKEETSKDNFIKYKCLQMWIYIYISLRE